MKTVKKTTIMMCSAFALMLAAAPAYALDVGATVGSTVNSATGVRTGGINADADIDLSAGVDASANRADIHSDSRADIKLGGAEKPAYEEQDGETAEQERERAQRAHMNAQQKAEWERRRKENTGFNTSVYGSGGAAASTDENRWTGRAENRLNNRTSIGAGADIDTGASISSGGLHGNVGVGAKAGGALR